MHNPFNPADIDISNKLLTIDLLATRLRQNPQEIQMDTSKYFQRSSGLWNTIQQSRLIESILIRFPLPAFYFDGSDDSCWLVVDGLQRLTSLNNFIVHKTLKLTDLEFLTQLEGKGFDDIGRVLQRVLLECQIVTFIINPGTPDDVKFNIFKRINTGGLVLNGQEIRHALNQGPAVDFLVELVALSSFLRVTNDTPDDRMLKRELINRFFVFFWLDHNAIESNIDDAMERVLKFVKTLPEADKAECRIRFDRAMDLSHFIFGNYAFRKRNFEKKRRNRLNKALFDVVAVTFAQLSQEQCSILMVRKAVFYALYEKLMADQIFIDSISNFTSEQRRIEIRYAKMRKVLQQTLECNP